MANTAKETRVSIPAVDIGTFSLRLVGDSSLVVHKWSDKAKKMMLDKQMKKAKGGKEAKDPEQDYQDSLYHMPDGEGYGFPAVAFKAAAIGACRFVDGLSMTEARGAFHVQGELVRIEGEPQMREDMVRLETGTADIRYRGEFPKWETTISIRFNRQALTVEQLINLFNIAGFSIGVGEGRPLGRKSSGSWGMFHVAPGSQESSNGTGEGEAQ